MLKTNKKLSECPNLVAEWHPLKNGNLTPNDVVSGSHKKAWWLGKCGHEWNACIKNRSNNAGCPYCTGQKVCEDNCLAMLYQDIAVEWHPTKNSNLTPSDVTSRTDKKVWWLGKCGHEWDACIANRTGNNTGCPYCTGRKVCEDNCLASLYQDIAAEWHPTKNDGLSPKDVTSKTDKKVWWLGKCGHEWLACVSNRTSNNTGCPHCRMPKRQIKLYEIIKRLYPNDFIQFNYWHPDLRFKKSNRMMQLDIYLPELKLAFEYQGEWHFDISVMLWRKGMDWCQEKNKENWARDEEKREVCKNNGIKLVEIDYGWDESEESVRCAIAGGFKPFRPKMEKTGSSTRIYVD